MAIASVLKYYAGAITVSDIRKMPNREFVSYLNAANKIESVGEEPKGLTGDDALNAMMKDPAIRKPDGNIR